MVIQMNKIIIFFTCFIIFSAIVIDTSFKVVEKHNEKLLLVDKKKIIESAKKCINEKKCNQGKITLKELYDLNYLDVLVNKVTKEYYNDKSYAYIDEEKELFIIVD